MKSILLLSANRMRPGRVHWAQEQHVQMLGGKNESKVLQEPLVLIIYVWSGARSQAGRSA